MPADSLFTPILVPDSLLEATSDRAWLRAMLDAEAALARAEAAAGLIPPEAASAIAGACSRLLDPASASTPPALDPAALGQAARQGGNPVIPLVRAVRAAVPEAARRHVHHGATSQDILDTAAVLVAHRATTITLAELDGLAAECAALAEQHRHTVMAGRTLLQQAVPTTFGLKAAGWLAGVVEARRLLVDAHARLAVQLGGAAGTLAVLGTRGPEVMARFAAELGLAEPALPWHTARQRPAELAASLGIVAGTAAKIGGDVVLLSQTEVGEVAEAAAPGRGGSSTMPHKRNPVHAIAAVTAARRGAALVPVVLEALGAEHERAAGGWQAEWETITDLLALAGGAVAHARASLHGLEVDAVAMARNLGLTGGALMAERVVMALAPELGHEAATERVERAAQAASAHHPFADALRADPVLAGTLDDERLAELLDPSTYLGAADTWIDRALALYREDR